MVCSYRSGVPQRVQSERYGYEYPWTALKRQRVHTDYVSSSDMLVIIKSAEAPLNFSTLPGLFA